MFEVSLAAYLVVHLANFSVVLDLHIKCRMTDVRTAICPLLRNGSNYRRALPRASVYHVLQEFISNQT